MTIGSRGMAMNFSSATQGSAFLSAGSQSAGALDYAGSRGMAARPAAIPAVDRAAECRRQTEIKSAY